MKTNRIKMKYLINIDNYISKKDNKLLFLIGMLAVIPSILSGEQNMNLWEKLILIIHNPIANILFYIGTIIIVLCVRRRICFNELFFSRYSNYKEMIINGIKSISLATAVFYTIFIFIALAASTFFCIGNYNIGIYDKYNISIVIYLAFIYIKNVLIYSIISSLIFMLSIFITKKQIQYFLLFLTFLFFGLSYKNNDVAHFYQISVLFQSYLINNNYVSFYTEIVVSAIYVTLIILISRLLFNHYIKRKITLE